MLEFHITSDNSCCTPSWVICSVPSVLLTSVDTLTTAVEHITSCRVLFFAAKPKDEKVFDALRREAADQGDVVVLPGIFEHYHNITHQTLEILRAASMDAVATHALKVRPVHVP